MIQQTTAATRPPGGRLCVISGRGCAFLSYKKAPSKIGNLGRVRASHAVPCNPQVGRQRGWLSWPAKLSSRLAASVEPRSLAFSYQSLAILMSAISAMAGTDSTPRDSVCRTVFVCPAAFRLLQNGRIIGLAKLQGRGRVAGVRRIAVRRRAILMLPEGERPTATVFPSGARRDRGANLPLSTLIS
jgi:hypothetical protein